MSQSQPTDPVRLGPSLCGGLLGAADVLGVVDRCGPSTLQELEDMARGEGFLDALDACVDGGWLDVRAWGDGSLAESRYCLTDCGRHALHVAGRHAWAA